MVELSFFTSRLKSLQHSNVSSVLASLCLKKNIFFLFLILLALSFLLLPLKAIAINPVTNPLMWKNIFGTHQALPPYVILVDKDKQHLAVYKGNKAYTLAQSYTCTTGKRIGNKEIQGDLKTPEGIYFVVRHISSGLDFAKYGDEAYTLNYPNPVDRLRKKTGYGIWIHGRGETITPLLTEGCIALDNENLKNLGSLLTPGAPVALTNSFAQTPKTLPKDATTATFLVNQVEEWAKSWASRSTKLFQFYNAEAYSVANEPFSQFKGQKERLFKQLPWIKTTVHNVQVLKGPDYWVTWFFQNYEAPNLTSNGIRRLYWQQNSKGKYVIVGMEWIPGLTTDTYIADVDPSPLTGTDTVSEPLVEHTPDYETEIPVAPPTSDKDELAKPLLALALYEKNLLRLDNTTLLAMNTSLVLESTATQQTATQQTATQQTATQQTATQPQVFKTLEQNIPPPLAAQQLTQKLTQPVLVAMGSGNKVSDQGGIIPVDNATALADEEKAVSAETTPIAEENTSGEQTTLEQSTAQKQQAEQSVIAEQGATVEQGTTAEKGRNKKTLEQNVAETGINIEEQLHISIIETVNEWGTAWEEGDLKWYMEYYLKDATQARLKSSQAIYTQKEQLWKHAAPAKVAFSNFTITLKGELAVVSMHQIYTNKNGKKDQGIKTLKLKRIGDMWFIADEQWRSL